MTLKQTIENLPADTPLLASSKETLLSWLSGAFPPDWALESLNELVESGAWDELNDRFFKNLRHWWKCVDALLAKSVLR